MRQKIIVGLVMVLVLGVMGVAAAQKGKPEAKAIKKVTEKTIEGEVTWIGKDKIAITYTQDDAAGTAEEMLLPISEDVKLLHKRSLDEIKQGDRVSIQYKEVSEESAKEIGEVTREAKTITFKSPAIKKPVPILPDEEKVLKSKE